MSSKRSEKKTAPPARAIASAASLHHLGCYVLPAKGNLGKTWGLAPARSRGTWFVVGTRNIDFILYEIQMPDDERYPGGPLPPALDQADAPLATLVHNWGNFLSATAGGPLVPDNDECYGLYFDDERQRLYASYGDFYAQPPTRPTLLVIDFSGATPTIIANPEFGIEGKPCDPLWSFTQFVPAGRTLARLTGRPYATHGYQTSTYQTGSWAPGMMLTADPGLDVPAMIDARKAMFWPSKTVTITLDTGKVKTGFLTSDMRRRDASAIISGNSSNYLGGTPEWSDVPYGRTPIEGGWVNSDDQGHFVIIDECDIQGALYFGTYGEGYQWYGTPVEFADDYTPTPSSPTGFQSWAGIDAPGTQAYFQSERFKADPVNNPKNYIVGRQGGGKGNHTELVVPCVWCYSLLDIAQAAAGTYINDRTGDGLNVEYSSFDVLASPLEAAALQIACPTFQYDHLLTPHTQMSPNHKHKTRGAYYRPEGVGPMRGWRRLYVRCNSALGSGNDVVNVFFVGQGGA